MGIVSKIGDALLGSTVKSVENVALEFIQTDAEKAAAEKTSAEAKALFVKTLDPNGSMRRDVMRFVCGIYGFYLLLTVPLIFCTFFGVGDTVQAKLAMSAITETFLPITGLFTAIVSASFGVNATNTIQEAKKVSP